MTEDVRQLLARIDATGAAAIPVDPAKPGRQGRWIIVPALLAFAIAAAGLFGTTKPGEEWQRWAFIALFAVIGLLLLAEALVMRSRWRAIRDGARPLEIRPDGGAAYRFRMLPEREPEAFSWTTAARVDLRPGGPFSPALAGIVEGPDLRTVLAAGPAAALAWLRSPMTSPIAGVAPMLGSSRRHRIPDVYALSPTEVQTVLEHARGRAWQRIAADAARAVPGHPPQAWAELSAALEQEA